MQIEVQCSKNYFKFFLPQEAGAFGNNIEKETQKPRLQSSASGIFLQKCINFLEQRYKFSHFKDSIMA